VCIKIDFVVHAAYKLLDFFVDADNHRRATNLSTTSNGPTSEFMTRPTKKKGKIDKVKKENSSLVEQREIYRSQDAL